MSLVVLMTTIMDLRNDIQGASFDYQVYARHFTITPLDVDITKTHFSLSITIYMRLNLALSYFQKQIFTLRTLSIEKLRQSIFEFVACEGVTDVVYCI